MLEAFGKSWMITAGNGAASTNGGDFAVRGYDLRHENRRKRPLVMTDLAADRSEPVFASDQTIPLA
jgi:hypothetical protein